MSAELEKELAQVMRWRLGGAHADVVRFFRGRSEAERRALAPFVARCHREAVRRARRGGEREYSDWDTSLALVATSTLSELEKKLRALDVNHDACRVLMHRNPPWLAEAFDLFLRRAHAWSIADIVYCMGELVASGRIPEPANERYAIGVAYVCCGYQNYLDVGVYARSRHDKGWPIVEEIRRNIDSVEAAIWRQFEVEGDDDVSLSICQTLTERENGGWAGALRTAANEGLLDRQRLLDASLEALARGFAPHRARWHYRFHELMEPTPLERVARAGLYFDLLASPVGPIASFAIAALTIVGKRRLLEPERVVDRVEPALFSSTGATVKSGMRLLANAVDMRPDMASRALRLFAVVLEHKSTELQETAFDHIEKLADAIDDEGRAAIEERLHIMSPALKSRADALLYRGHAPARTAAPRDSGDDLAQLRARAETLPPDLRRLAGVDAAIAAMESHAFDIAAAPFNGMDIPRLDPSARHVPIPINCFEAFIDEALVAVEHPDDIERVERVLAAALRFSANRPANAERLLSPLGKALARRRSSRSNRPEWGTPLGALRIVLTACLGEETHGFVHTQDPSRAMWLRAHAAAEFIRKGESATQLSEPTHRGFWIDPVVAVERSLAAQAPGAPSALGVADKILTLMRLAPDRLEEARRAAGEIGDEWGVALRHALGGAEEGVRIDEALASAARGARVKLTDGARGSCVSLSGVPGAEQFADVAAIQAVSPWAGHEPRREGQSLTSRDLVQPDRVWPLEEFSDGFLHGNWARALWPQHPDLVFVAGTRGKCFDSEPGVCAIPEGVSLLLDPDVPSSPDALRLLALAIDGAHKPTARAGVDALIAMIEDGRLDGESLGQVMHHFLGRSYVVAKRWAPHLRDVADSSPVAAFVVRRALERALAAPAPEQPVREIFSWIDLLRELCARTGAPVSDPRTRRGLEQHGGHGKAAKSARALLAFSPGKEPPLPFHVALEHALERRIARAERWLGWRRGSM
ncbi:MAG TPA: DUF6493 family protein [Methylocystis sp.]